MNSCFPDPSHGVIFEEKMKYFRRSMLHVTRRGGNPESATGIDRGLDGQRIEDVQVRDVIDWNLAWTFHVFRKGPSSTGSLLKTNF